MSKLSEFIKQNKDLCYSVAENNTKKDKNNKVSIPQNDEWIKEKEWDKMLNT